MPTWRRRGQVLHRYGEGVWIMFMRSFFMAGVALTVMSLALLLTWSPAEASKTPTKVMVRAISKDAKVIGTKVGGARITIREVATGTILAEGVAEGGTGSTELIMVRPRERGAKVFDDPDAAGFLATLMLEQPTVVEVTAVGPLGAPQSTQRSSKTLLLVPGQHVLGEGIVLEIHGFTVELLMPPSETGLGAGQTLEIRAAVTMT